MDRTRSEFPEEAGWLETADREDPPGLAPPKRGGAEPLRPTWRGLLIAVIAAIVLSVGATLLLGGSFGFTRQVAAGGCGAGAAGDCCAPRGGR